MAVQSSSTRYVASVPPNREQITPEISPYIRWMYEEFQRVSQAISSLEHQYPPLTEAPERVTVGLVAYADGVGWNPTGGGEGLYIYKSTGWTKIV